MEIYDAILAAADHIEAHPKEFDFGQPKVPKGPGCGSPGCALGWIGAFYGRPDDKYFGYRRVAREILGLSPEDRRDSQGRTWGDGDGDEGDAFYNRMDEFESEWQWNVAACARALRLYAKKYHAFNFADVRSEELG